MLLCNQTSSKCWCWSAAEPRLAGWIATDMGFRFPGDKFQAVSNAFEARMNDWEG